MRKHRDNPDSDEMRQAEAETIRRLAELRLFDPSQLAIIARMKTWKDEDCDPTP